MSSGLPPKSNAGPRSPPSAPLRAQSGTSSGGDATVESSQAGPASKRRHRAGKKHRKNRRQSFAVPSDQGEVPDTGAERPSLLDVPEEKSTEEQFYRIGAPWRKSNDSMESEALLDHRHQHTTRPRRQSVLHSLHAYNSEQMSRAHPRPNPLRGTVSAHAADYNGRNDENEPTDRTPLMANHNHHNQDGYRKPPLNANYGASNLFRPVSNNRRPSASSSLSTKRRKKMPSRQQSTHSIPTYDEYDINNPPSQPGSPRLGPDDDFDEVMLPEFHQHGSREGSRVRGDHIINIDDDEDLLGASPMKRRPTLGTNAVEDVCLPFDQMTDIPEEEFLHQEGSEGQPRRGRKRPWPDLSALEEWATDEKEERTLDGVRAKKVNEPELVGGRLRPSRVTWQREEEDEATFRFTYFNEELDSSLRSHTLSGLQQLGLSFRELFIPDLPEVEESSDDEDDVPQPPERVLTPLNGASRAGTRQSSLFDTKGQTEKQSSAANPPSGRATPTPRNTSPMNTSVSGAGKPKRLGPRPVFWLDVLRPTFEEMRVICRAFGIHKLTAEDIMEQEAREKVELFRNYYFVNYRTFDQDQQSDQYMDPVNMYFVVFKGGVISFHFEQMPHPPNVRRRIRQLAEHQYTDSDWISYAIIDNITDAYAPLIEQIEKEVDGIDDEILQLHSRSEASDFKDPVKQRPMEEKTSKGKQFLNAFKTGDVYEKLADSSDDGTVSERPTHGDMLLRVGECRKKVMGLYRLLGNKADVIKGLAKRCNEQWQVAPRSDVGLYLGDIQDHIVTMTGNLTHYEK